MLAFLRALFLSDEFMPHGHCFSWRPGLVWLHVSSDALIGTAYLVISLTLWHLVRRIRIPFTPMILAFGMFIGVCGLTHYMEILTLWVPDYWLSGVVKAVTATASVATTVYLFEAKAAIVAGAEGAELAERRRLQLDEVHQKIEDAARRHQRAFQALGDVSDALVRATDERTLLEAVCRIFVDVGGYRLCWVGLAEHDDRKTVRPVAHAGHEAGYLAHVDAVWSEEGTGPSGRAIRSGKPAVIQDLAAASGLDAWRDEALRRGYASLAAVPLVAGGETLGVIRIYADRTGAFDDAELKLLGKIADDLAYGVAALRARAEHIQMNAQLMQSDRMASVGVLAAGVAHEINNPLAYLIASLDFIDAELKRSGRALPEPLLEDVGHALSDAREGAARVRHVVRDLKTFSRGDEEQNTRIEVRPVIESSINMAYNEIRYRARLVKDYGKAPPVLASPARLGQVFLNLLINAAQAIPEGHADENEIRIATRTDPAGRALIEVRDSGAGIRPEIVGRIFDPFFTTKPVGVGTGLGLSICHNIVRGLGGEISVESQVGQGTLFRVALPASPPEVGDELTPPPDAATSARRGRVLVVDDEPAVGSAVRRTLAREHDVRVLSSAVEALDLFRAGERFDVIVCDLMMPKMSGMELHAELARIAPDQARRMVLLTGGAFTPSAQQFLDRVPNARVEKPFEAASLRVLVRGLVG